MKKFYCLWLLAIAAISLNAQTWLKSSPKKNTGDFYSIQKKFYDYFKDQPGNAVSEEESDGDKEKFERWNHFMEIRSYPSGRIPDPDILLKEYEQRRTFRPAQSQLNTANWTYVGPKSLPNNRGGAGRINCIAFHPVNHNVIYTGAACGGVWQTNDGGLTWFSTTDQLASISIADIAIDPANPNNIYVATGDGYGYESSGSIFWGGTYTAGVMKSTDGGITWASSGLTYSQTQTEIIQRLIINPQNPSILLACTRNAIYRSTDGAASWNPVIFGHFYDMEFKPFNPNIIYASIDNYVYRSTDGGASFQPHSNNFGVSGRLSIDVTPADSNLVYAFDENASFYHSTNGGQNFTFRSTASGSYNGYYDCVLAASPVNTLHALVGGVSMRMTIDGGLTWTNIISTGFTDYVHVDQHALIFLPGSDSTFFSGNDGGVFKTTDNGNSWTDLSTGMDIKQYYRLSSSEKDPSIIYAGAQDNGTDQLNGSRWTRVLGGDGMDCLTDYSDRNVAYGSSQYGNFSITVDGGQTFDNISPPTSENGYWITPIVQDPVDPLTIYTGYTKIYKSQNQGTSWDSMAAGVFTNDIRRLAVAHSNTNYIYACNMTQFQRTSNGGTSWTSIAAGLPTGSAAIADIAVCDTNPQIIWAVLSGYLGGAKVYKSINAGSSWTNITGSLPNVPTDCIVHQRNSMNDLYIGTDFGVYYRNDTMSDWAPYQNGLPNVIVADIEINYTASKLRVATYGRGVWESDLNTSTLKQTDAGLENIVFPLGLACSTTFNPKVILKNFGTDNLISANIKYRTDAGSWQSQAWSGILPTNSTDTVTVGPATGLPGAHILDVMSENPNGVADMNPDNDQLSISFDAIDSALSYPMAEDFENGIIPPLNWHLFGDQSLLSIQPYGSFGASSACMMADFYHTLSSRCAFVSSSIDMTNSAPPVHLSFHLSYADAGTPYKDSLIVSISPDCGVTWTTMYAKSGLSLATAPSQLSEFSPGSSDWRADTISLDSWAGTPELLIRFEAQSGSGNNLYIDNINLTAGTIGTQDLETGHFLISPVPFTKSLEIYSAEDLNAVMLTDITGKTIYHRDDIKTKSITVDTENISAGIYFLKLIIRDKMFVRKVMKGRS